MQIAMQNTEFSLYCDLDGVLVDFLRGKTMLGPMSGNQAWNAIRLAGADYWANLPWTVDGKELWRNLLPFHPVILTAYPNFRATENELVSQGKTTWVYRELGVIPMIICEKHHKCYYAAPKSILVDDDLDNIREWKAAGGIGIFHESASQTLLQLSNLKTNTYAHIPN